MILTIDEVKAHLRIEDDEEDDYLLALILQAQATAENYCRVKFDEAVEGSVRLAVLLMVSYLYENRDTPDLTIYGTMRIAFENLLYPYHDPDKIF